MNATHIIFELPGKRYLKIPVNRALCFGTANKRAEPYQVIWEDGSMSRATGWRDPETKAMVRIGAQAYGETHLNLTICP